MEGNFITGTCLQKCKVTGLYRISKDCLSSETLYLWLKHGLSSWARTSPGSAARATAKTTGCWKVRTLSGQLWVAWLIYIYVTSVYKRAYVHTHGCSYRTGDGTWCSHDVLCKQTPAENHPCSAHHLTYSSLWFFEAHHAVFPIWRWKNVEHGQRNLLKVALLGCDQARSWTLLCKSVNS